MRLLQLALCGGGSDICKHFTYLTFSCVGGVFLAQTLYLHSGCLPSGTCTGGLVPSSTGAFTACADCNLHCIYSGGGDGVIEVVPYMGG